MTALMTHALAAWEAGLAQNDIERALTLTALALPGRAREELAHMPLGIRDAALLGLRETLFGTKLAGVVACPACGERLELTLDTRQLPRATEPPPAALTLTTDEYQITYRPPDSADLLAVQACTNVVEGRARLLERCAQVTNQAGAAVAAQDLTAELQHQLAEQLALADPHADLEVTLDCPACGNVWSVTLDVAAFLWRELHQWAGRMLLDVHRLASRYGWTESEILNLTPLRRQMYLDFLSNG